MVARNGHRTYAKTGLLPLKPGVWCTRLHALLYYILTPLYHYSYSRRRRRPNALTQGAPPTVKGKSVSKLLFTYTDTHHVETYTALPLPALARALASATALASASALAVAFTLASALAPASA